MEEFHKHNKGVENLEKNISKNKNKYNEYESLLDDV